MNTLRSLRAACALLLLCCPIGCSRETRPLHLADAGATATIGVGMPRGRDLFADTLLRRSLTEYFSAFADVYFGGGELGPVAIDDTTIEHFGVLLAMTRERYLVDAFSDSDYYRVPDRLVDSATFRYFGRTVGSRGLDRWSENGGYVYRKGYYYFHRYDFDSHDDEGDAIEEREHPQIEAMVERADGILAVRLAMLSADGNQNGTGEVDRRVLATIRRIGGRFILTGYSIEKI